ncbi:MAG TPA: hypothetical protein VJR89_32905 [Polyangiales bacterium]|nr:hypothetical protein [Polyangiales bacterium]
MIAFERAHPRLRALLREAIRTKTRVIIPAGALGQAFRDASRQVRLRALLSGPTSEVPPLDQLLAEAAGALCGRTKTSDVIDASVVLTARRCRAPVITSDVADLRKLDPTLQLERV